MSDDGGRELGYGQDDRDADTVARLPSIPMAGLSASEAVQFLCLWFGDDVIKRAVKARTAPKRGRRKIDDWPALKAEYETDAREWLAGGDPFVRRSNYQIAKALAQTQPGSSREATHERLENKMAKKPHDRGWWTIIFAVQIGRNEYPYAAYLRAVEEYDALQGCGSTGGRDLAEATLRAYASYHGSLPSSRTTFREIEDAVAGRAQITT